MQPFITAFYLRKKNNTSTTPLQKPKNLTAYIQALYMSSSAFVGNHLLLQGITMTFHDCTS
jgi:hypothetical protein